MYVSAPWSVVHAVDARTGKALWTYDPQVPREMAYKGCCDVVNRGVAVYKGKVFVAAFDGRLIALDAATGRQVWSTDTIDNKNFSYTITGAPRVFKGKVYIGNGGAEYGARGYVTAYDAETGKQVWRFYTVPGDPAQAYESKALEEAAKTWDPAGRYWESGGGGTVWNSLVFDPELDQMYIGVGNGSPWAHRKRSPAGETTSIWAPSWRWIRTRVPTNGITRKRRAITGTSLLPRISCRLTSGLTASCARCCCMRPRMATFL
jgi:quinohemoprotein ethanol dehydrogenase